MLSIKSLFSGGYGYNRQVSQMRALLANCGELTVDYNTLPDVLYVFEHKGVGGAVRFLVVGIIGKEERPPQGQLWMEQYLISLKYWPI